MGNKYYLIIAAAGKSKRFGEDKLFQRINKKTILELSISNFKDINFEKKVLVLSKEKIKDEKLKEKFKNFLTAEGGKKRAISVYKGFLKISPEENSYVIIHDGARPFVPISLIKNLLKEIKNEMAVIPVIPVKETLKKIKNNFVEKTIEREGLFFVQTPQIFKAKTLYEGYKLERKIWENLTDESQLLEILNIPIKTIIGSTFNIKITYKEDLKIIKNYYK